MAYCNQDVDNTNQGGNVMGLESLDKILTGHKELVRDVLQLKISVRTHEANGGKLPETITLRLEDLFDRVDRI